MIIKIYTSINLKSVTEIMNFYSDDDKGRQLAIFKPVNSGPYRATQQGPSLLRNDGF